MGSRHSSLMHAADTAPAPCRLTLRAPPNWSAVLFFAGLSALHFSVALPAFYHHRWEGFLSAVFGVLFMMAAVACRFVANELTIEGESRRISLRAGWGPFHIERFIGFDNVHGVRLTMAGSSPRSSRIELLCDNEDLECPPTSIPRQQALCLAVLMQVRLIKVYGGSESPGENAEFHRM